MQTYCMDALLAPHFAVIVLAIGLHIIRWKCASITIKLNWIHIHCSGWSFAWVYGPYFPAEKNFHAVLMLWCIWKHQNLMLWSSLYSMLNFTWMVTCHLIDSPFHFSFHSFFFWDRPSLLIPVVCLILIHTFPCVCTLDNWMLTCCSCKVTVSGERKEPAMTLPPFYSLACLNSCSTVFMIKHEGALTFIVPKHSIMDWEPQNCVLCFYGRPINGNLEKVLELHYNKKMVQINSLHSATLGFY